MPAITYKNAELLALIPTDGQASTRTISQDRLGVTSYNTEELWTIKNSTQTVTINYNVNHQESQYLVDFFIDKKGKSEVIWLPSFTPDFQVINQNQQVLTATGDSGFLFDGQTLVLTHANKDGLLYVFEGVVNYDENLKRANIHTDLPDGYTVKRGDSLFITRLARFDTDTLEYQENKSNQDISLTFKLLETNQE